MDIGGNVYELMIILRFSIYKKKNNNCNKTVEGESIVMLGSRLRFVFD